MLFAKITDKNGGNGKRNGEKVQRELSHGKKDDDGKLVWSTEGMARITMSGLYVVCDRITIRIKKISRATDLDVRKSSTASSAPGLEENLKVSIIKVFWHLFAM